jgi:hypothetical protein
MVLLFFTLKPTSMNTKTLLAGLLAGIITFLLGWLIFGMLLMDFYMSNSTLYTGLMKDPPDFVAIFIANLSWGLLIAYIFNLAGIKTTQNGAITGVILFFLVVLGVDLLYYAQMNLFGLKVVLVDVFVNAIMGGIIGAFVGWWFGRPGKA